MRKIVFFLTWFLCCWSPIGLQLQSNMASNIWSLWSETPSINHVNYPSPCNIYDNAANDTALIASIPHLFWWPDTQIRKKPVSSRCSSNSIHHHLSFVCDECYIYGALFQLFVPLCHSSSAAHVKLEFCLVQIQTAGVQCNYFSLNKKKKKCGNAVLPWLHFFLRIFIVHVSATIYLKCSIVHACNCMDKSRYFGKTVVRITWKNIKAQTTSVWMQTKRCTIQSKVSLEISVYEKAAGTTGILKLSYSEFYIMLHITYF